MVSCVFPGSFDPVTKGHLTQTIQMLPLTDGTAFWPNICTKKMKESLYGGSEVQPK